LLDEHFSPRLAHCLRALGHDVVAVKERPDLIGAADHVHFASLPDERRAIVTQDLGDFRPLLTRAMHAGAQTCGLVCVPSRVSLRRDALGELVEALDRLLKRNPDDAAAARGGEIWLTLE
jgi:nucleoside-diphosphate-sugar epimerase